MRPRSLLLVVALSAVSSACSSESRLLQESASDPAATNSLFSSPAAINTTFGNAELRVQQIGLIELNSGQLAVSDAFINDAPLRVGPVPTGAAPVEVLLASFGADSRVAAARVRFFESVPDQWRHVGAVPIDSGTGALFDASLQLATASTNTFVESLSAALDATYRPTWSHAALTWQGTHFIAFSTGFGDGTYPVFMGTSATGEILTILVDCELVP